MLFLAILLLTSGKLRRSVASAMAESFFALEVRMPSGAIMEFSEEAVRSFGDIGSLRRHVAARYAQEEANKEMGLTPYNVHVSLVA